MKIDWNLNGKAQSHDLNPLEPVALILESMDQLKPWSGDRSEPLVLVDGEPCNPYRMRNFGLKGKNLQTLEGLMETELFFQWERVCTRLGVVLCRTCSQAKSLMALGLILQEAEIDRDAIINCLPQPWCPCDVPTALIASIIETRELIRRRSSVKR